MRGRTASTSHTVAHRARCGTQPAAAGKGDAASISNALQSPTQSAEAQQRKADAQALTARPILTRTLQKSSALACAGDEASCDHAVSMVEPGAEGWCHFAQKKSTAPLTPVAFAALRARACGSG